MKKIVIEKHRYGLSIDPEPYTSWLEQARASLPQAVRDYIDGMLDGQAGDFSVHDADFVSFSLQESQGDGEYDLTTSTAELVYDDGPVRVRVCYGGVRHYALRMDNDEKPSSCSSTCTALLEEVTVSEDGLVRHEILWNNGSTVVVCEDFTYVADLRGQGERSRNYADIRMCSLFPKE